MNKKSEFLSDLIHSGFEAFGPYFGLVLFGLTFILFPGLRILNKRNRKLALDYSQTMKECKAPTRDQEYAHLGFLAFWFGLFMCLIGFVLITFDKFGD